MSPSLYSPVYMTFVTLMTIMLANKYSRYTNSRLESHWAVSPINALTVCVIFVFFIGLRPVSGVFVDMRNYWHVYNMLWGNRFVFDWNAENLIFDNLIRWFAGARINITYFFLIIAAINFGSLLIACRRLFPKDTLYAFIIYLGAFSTFSYATNGIKAGAAASIFLCALAYKDKWWLSLIFLWISLGFHHSMTLPITAFLICWFVRNPRLYLTIWCASVVISALHISFFQEIFASMADERGAGYLGEDAGVSYVGFRPDFILYSAAPVILGYWVIKTKGYRSKLYDTMYCTYLLTNSVWMLCMYANFTNRIAYLSWLMLPIVLTYPFFDKPFMRHQYSGADRVAGWHLAFTLAMQIIYYGLLGSHH